MKKNLKNQIEHAINSTFDGKLNEAYVTEPKVFDLRTDLLSSATKKAQQKEFEEFRTFKRI